MTITYPIALLDTFPGWSTEFRPEYMVELDATRSGKTIAKDLGPPVWIATYESRLLKPSELRFWKARIASLEGGAQYFYGYDTSACYPIAYPRGSWPTGPSFSGVAKLNVVNANMKTIRLEELPEDYVISVGDYLAFDYGSGSRALHQAVESVVVGPSGVSPDFEVRPHIRTGFALEANVSLIRPAALMAVVPNSISASASPVSGKGTVSFSARQAI